MKAVIEQASDLAIELAGRAGRLARFNFGGSLDPAAKTSPVDVVTSVDKDAEHLITTGIHDVFPEHSINAEETGLLLYGSATCEPEWLWLIDPLDGTGNYTIGLPVYGLSIALLNRGRPVLALVQDSHLDRMLLVNEMGDIRKSSNMVLYRNLMGSSRISALQQGYQVRRSDHRLAAIRNYMEQEFGRVLYSWSPSVDSLLLASGALGVVVAFECLGPEHVAARTVAEVLGFLVLDSHPSHDARVPTTYAVGRQEQVSMIWDEVLTRLG